MANVYEIITDRIVKLLEQGTIPWQQPWSGEAFAPRNVISGKCYRGINAFLLSSLDYDNPYWLTFNQAKKLGGSVKKGSESAPVVFWKWLEKESDEEGKPKKVPLIRYYRVFHISQCELPAEKIPEPPSRETFDFTPIERCEQLLAAIPDGPTIENTSRLTAGYQPSSDKIRMPPPELFTKPEHYYATLFHELIHSTGHQSRLNREGIATGAKFRSPTYCKEELIAEFGSAFLCGHCGIEKPIIENAASYIDGWLKTLRAHPRFAVQSAASAQKAADLLLGKPEYEEE